MADTKNAPAAAAKPGNTIPASKPGDAVVLGSTGDSAAPGATASAPAGDTPAPAAAAAAKPSKPDAIVLPVRTNIPIPTGKARAGAKSKYDFDGLEVGGSFGIKGRNAAGLQSTISQKNRNAMVEKRDAAGNVIFKMIDAKDENGNIGGKIPSTEPEMVAGKKWMVADVDPKTDPDNADCRVWRTA